MTAKERRLLEAEMKRYREFHQSPRVCQSCGQTFPNKDFLLVTEPIENSWLQHLCPGRMEGTTRFQLDNSHRCGVQTRPAPNPFHTYPTGER